MIEEIDKTYAQIENKILNHEIYQNVKDYSKAKEKMKTYLEVGKLLKDADIKYGNNVIKDYSNRLTIKFGKKYTTSLLYKIKQFYNIVEKVPTLSWKLTWSHWYEMLPINEINKIIYYVNHCEMNNIDVSDLRSKISKEYERLPEDTKTKLIIQDKIEIKDLVPNPIIIKNSNNYEIISKKVLQKLILEDIESFMNELGNSFSFIGSEYKIRIDNTFNYIDLLLFNIEYNCYVVIELKVTEFKVEYISQVQKYMNYIDKNIKQVSNNNTIGILICKRENKFVIEYCSDERIAVREYELVWYNGLRRTIMIYTVGMLCKHFKGTNLLEKNIYRIEKIGIKGSDIDKSLITYTGDGELKTATNLVVYSNIFQDNKLFCHEYEDISGELSDEKKKCLIKL